MNPSEDHNTQQHKFEFKTASGKTWPIPAEVASKEEEPVTLAALMAKLKDIEELVLDALDGVEDAGTFDNPMALCVNNAIWAYHAILGIVRNEWQYNKSVLINK